MFGVYLYAYICIEIIAKLYFNDDKHALYINKLNMFFRFNNKTSLIEP